MSQRTLITLSIVGALMLSICPGSRSWAQMPMGDPPPMADRSNPDKELKRMNKVLKLSDDQKTRILPILQRRKDAIEKLLADQETSMQDKFPKITAIRDRSNEEIRSLLNEAQRKDFDRQVAEEKKRMESGPDGGPNPGDPPPPPE
ncbi:hypothetical protein [Terriglobus albidus]|uniref:hypothetical protein n=1 Tax=Terriglobus albidus TaxID=1592106 RepID=UPI0021DFF39C|nr:hypothetical protein [Terriglobus albidus]